MLAVNACGVNRPSQNEPSPVMFETTVDLVLARLRRQMIRTTDATGATLYGLREIFEKK